MANEYLVNSVDMTAVADAIRTKGGTSEALTFPSGFVDAVGAIHAAGGAEAEDKLAKFINREWDEDGFYNENIKYVVDYSFHYHLDLKGIINLPNCVKICDHAFSNSSGVTGILLPKATNIYGQEQCNGDSGLQYFKAPLLTGTMKRTFNVCSRLELVDAGFVANLDGTVFWKCTKLTTLILRSDTVVTMAASNCFGGTPYNTGGSGGKVYVPAALIETYKTETNWSAYYGYGTMEFVAIEGSEYE